MKNVYYFCDTLNAPVVSSKINHYHISGSWIGSVLNLGALASALVGGYMMNSLGPKWTMLFMAIPFSVGNLLILLPYPLKMADVPSKWLFFAGRFFVGDD